MLCFFFLKKKGPLQSFFLWISQQTWEAGIGTTSSFKAGKNQSPERSSDLAKVTQQRNDNPRLKRRASGFQGPFFLSTTSTFNSPFYSFSSSLVQSFPPYACWNSSILEVFLLGSLLFPLLAMFLFTISNFPLTISNSTSLQRPYHYHHPRSVSEAQTPPLHPYHRFCGFMWKFWGSHSGESLQKVRLSMAEDLSLQPCD